jgi:hypothetical protein
VRLLERGGDDVLLKPFSYPELRAGAVAKAAPVASSDRELLLQAEAIV